MKSYTWEESITTEKEKGFNAGATSSFVKTYVNFIKELLQNTLDQRKDNKKAIVRINLVDLKNEDFPDLPKYKEILKNCRNVNKQAPANKFFDKCLELIEKKEFPVLKVSEFDTTGLIYEKDNESINWYTFLKAEGLSTKGLGSGGSYGIGKTAIWNLSYFRTIFVSSFFNEVNGFIFQGSTEFIDYKKGGSQRYSGNVYYGEKDRLPITNESEINPFFKREKEDGTTFFILYPRFQKNEDWITIFIKVILNFFWYAVYCDELEIDVSGTLVNKTNLEALMTQYFDLDSPDDKKNEQDWNPLPYYFAVSRYKEDDPNHYLFIKNDFEFLGEAKLYVMTNPSFLSKVIYMRNNHMVIQKKPKGRLSNKPFAAVFITDDEKGSDMLRQMESPQHDEWTEDYAKARFGGELPPEFKKLEKEMRNFINDSIKKTALINESDEESVPEMEKLIPTDSLEGNDKLQKETYKEVDIESTDNQEMVTSPDDENKVPAINRGKEGTEKGKLKKKRKKKKRKGKKSKNVKIDPLSQKKVLIPVEVNTRSFAYEKTDGEYEHIVLLKSDVDTKIKIILNISGDTGDNEEPSVNKVRNIENADGCKLISNAICNINLAQNLTSKIGVVLDGGTEKYRLKINTYEDK